MWIFQLQNLQHLQCDCPLLQWQEAHGGSGRNVTTQFEAPRCTGKSSTAQVAAIDGDDMTTQCVPVIAGSQSTGDGAPVDKETVQEMEVYSGKIVSFTLTVCSFALEHLKNI